MQKEADYKAFSTAVDDMVKVSRASQLYQLNNNDGSSESQSSYYRITEYPKVKRFKQQPDKPKTTAFGLALEKEIKSK